jgi:hypothetical protein
MGRERDGQAMRARAGAAAAMGVLAALALGGCSGGSGLNMDTINKNLFGISSSKGGSAAGVGNGEVDAANNDTPCPDVTVRTGAATLMIGSKPGEGEPSALDLRYQGTIINTARECHVNSGLVTMRVGIQGRVITGPAGGPGTVDVPLRIAVVQEGVQPKTIVSKLSHVQVTVTSTFDRPTFTLVDPDIAFPLPVPLGAIDSYVVYVGFDPLGAQPQKKKPVRRNRSKAKPKLRPQITPQVLR